MSCGFDTSWEIPMKKRELNSSFANLTDLRNKSQCICNDNPPPPHTHTQVPIYQIKATFHLKTKQRLALCHVLQPVQLQG